MQLRSLPASAAALSLALATACDPGGDTATKSLGDDAPAPPTTAPAATGEAASEASEAAGPSREWVVWRETDGGYQTRWVAERKDGFETVAEVGALVHFQGGALRHIKREDLKGEVKSCACVEPDAEDACEQTGTIVSPGLVAISLADDSSTTLVPASKEETYGEVYDRSLRIQGGAGDLLFVATTDSGYYCGAHQSVGGTVQAIELSGEIRGELWKKLDPPLEVRKAAASGEVWKLYKECEQPEGTEEAFAAEILEPASLAIGLSKGQVQLTWGFEAFVPYVCSPDYSVYGEGKTGLIAAGAPAGLGEPLSKGLAAALADFGDASAVGWAEVTLEGEARTKQLEKFKGLGKVAWPAESMQEEAFSPPAAASPAQQLEAGRKLTRAGKYDEAIAAYDAAIAAEPGMHRAWAERGFAKLHQGDLDGAEADCSKAYALDDNPKFRGSIAYNLGLIDKKRGDLEAAKVHFENSLGMRPNAAVQKALDELNVALAAKK